MPANTYKVLALGGAVGIGLFGARYVALQGIAKPKDVAHPYLLANELICSSIARSLLLPCPPGAILEANGDKLFFSLDFNLSGQSLPPADASQIVQSDPRLSWGIILFDAFIMNHDRHVRNISYDSAAKKIQIFDHGHAFLQAGSQDIDLLLQANAGRICIGNHCLAEKINQWDGWDMWVSRIEQIPDYFIDGVVDAATTVGLPSAKAPVCASFLKDRKKQVRTIVQHNLGSFPNLPVQP